MKVTKIIYSSKEPELKASAVCDIILDDVLKIVGVRLYKNDKGYFLVFPSKQDIYQEVKNINKGTSIKVPNKPNNFKKDFEEFFYPVNSKCYLKLLSMIVDGFNVIRERNVNFYIPNDPELSN